MNVTTAMAGITRLFGYIEINQSQGGEGGRICEQNLHQKLGVTCNIKSQINLE